MTHDSPPIVQRFDFPFSKRDSYAVLPWVLAFMVFLTVISTALAINIHDIRQQWQAHYAHTVTLHVPATVKEPDGVRQRLHRALADKDGIRKVEWIQDDAVRLLLAPWLGDQSATEGLPVPVLVDVTLDAEVLGTVDFVAWQQENFPEVQADSHLEWLAEFNRLVTAIGQIALAVVAVIGLVTTVIVIMSTRTELALHIATLELLRMLGAENLYIAQQFQMKSLRMSLRGIVIGLVTALLLLLMLWYLSGHIQAPFFPLMKVGFSHILAMVVIGVAGMMVTGLSARITVMKQLKALD